MSDEEEPGEETLDPEDWEEMRALGHRAVDEAVDFLRDVRERPVWQPVPGEVAEALRRPLPEEGEGAEAAFEDFREHVMPYAMGNVHPRFWAWYMGNGTFGGAIADFLASTINSNLGGGSHSPGLVEAQVIDWFKEIAGYPAEASGLLVSGGSMANLVGLAVARRMKAEGDLSGGGMRAVARPMTVYASSEVHSCHDKTVELLGLGRDALRKIPVDSNFRIDLAALGDAIAGDREAGFQPFCVIGNAGTVNTGAVDDLNALADLCEKEDLWFHIDGAIGGVVPLAPENGHLVAGLARSDSLALDIHKWMHVPIEAGCAIVKDAEGHRDTFSLRPEYLEHAERGLSGGEVWFSDYGVQLSRNFKALKVWMSLIEHGTKKYGRLIDQNIRQAHALAELVAAAPDLEMCAPVELNIVCFRFVSEGMEEEALNALNKELLIRLQESGVAAPSLTTLNGVVCLRAALSNHRTRGADLAIFVEAVRKIGEELG